MSDRFKEWSSIAVKELTAVFDRMDDSNVRELLEVIKKTDRIFLLGGGREGLSTKAFAMRLMHLGKNAYWIWDDTTPSMGKGDLLICACGAADCGHQNHVVNMAKKSGATIGLVTAVDDGFMIPLADVKVKVPAAAFHATGDFVPTEQLMGNLFEQVLYVLYDVMVMMLREELGLTPDDMVARHRNVE